MKYRILYQQYENQFAWRRKQLLREDRIVRSEEERRKVIRDEENE